MEIERGIRKGLNSMELPRGWKESCLGDIYTERKEPGNDSLPILSVSIHSGVSDGELDEGQQTKKVKRIEDKSQYKRAASGDLVFNMMRAWQGAIGTVRTEGMVSPAYIVAKPNDMVDPTFMDYFMKTDRMINTLHRQSYGVTDFRLRLYWDSFAPIRCVLPPLEEQKKIVQILSAQDKVIELLDRKIEQQEQLKKYCFAKMFPRKGTNLPEIRFPEYSDPWEHRKLNQIADIIGGGTPSTANPEYWDGDIDWYAPAEIGEERYADGSVRRITELGLQKSSATILPAGRTILFTSRAGIGKTAILRRSGATNQGFQSIVLKDGINPYFIFSMSDSIKEKAETVASGSTFLEISGKMLGNIDVMIPNKPEQDMIAGYFEALDTIITLHQRKRDEEVKKKKALIQLLLTGIVRV